MQANVHKRVLKYFYLALVSCFLGAAKTAQADSTSVKAAEQLAEIADRVSDISIFWVTSTDSYSLDGMRFKDASSRKFYLRCGVACRDALNPVLKHLAQATVSECMMSSRNVMLEIGSEFSIIYGNSGRTIKVGEKCYFNKVKINSVIQDPSFLFN